MKVYDSRLGRLGNAIFRYWASTLFCIIYGAKRIYKNDETNATITDHIFIEWMNNILNDNIPLIPDKNYNFYGYFQHDKIFIKFKNELLLWMNENRNDLIYTDGNDSTNNNYRYNVQAYKVYDIIIDNININTYDVVIHLRLEDFIENNDTIHPDCIILIINNLKKKYSSYCLLLNKPSTIIETQYINYITNKSSIKLSIISGTVIEDLYVMRKAKVLVCSCSTLSWVGAYLSNTIELVYFPNKKRELHETFCKPIENTVYYDIIKCTKNELEKLFGIYIIDTYSITNYKGEPITNILVDYIKDIKNGFYIEVGAYDGIFQSSTKFIEDKFAWSGILIEPSLNAYIELEKNRQSNILINKCIVSNKYTLDKIQGAFNCGPMSSVNNIRSLPNVNLIEVPCDTLANIINIFNVKHIDLLSINTEGYEFEVLEGLDIKVNRPTYILITIFKKSKEKVFNYLELNNYWVIENVTNYNLFDNPQWDQLHNTYLLKSL